MASGMATTTLIMIIVTLVLPFAFVAVITTVQAVSRNRRIALIMEERRMLIQQGKEPAGLELPEDAVGRKDPLGNLKAGIMLLAVALGMVVVHFVTPGATFLAIFGGALALAILSACLGGGFIGVHYLGRALGDQDEDSDVDPSSVS